MDLDVSGTGKEGGEMADKTDHKPADAAAPAAPAAAQHSTPVGDSTAVSTQAAPEPTSSSVFEVGDSFPWEYRDTVEGEPDKDGVRKAEDRKTPVTATITNISRDIVWCDLMPPDSLTPEQQAKLVRTIGFPRRVHVMNADAAKALGWKLPPRSE